MKNTMEDKRKNATDNTINNTIKNTMKMTMITVILKMKNKQILLLVKTISVSAT